jgi:hypothetical protein
MGPTIGQPIPVRRTTTKKPTLQPSLRAHCCHHSVPSPRNLTLRLRAQQRHQGLVNRAVQLDRSAGLGQPHLHTHGIQPRYHLAKLVTVEGPLILSHHHSIELTIPIFRSRQQR